MIDHRAPSERQVLYALVGTGFVIVVAVFITGAALAGLVPPWWTVATATACSAVGLLVALRWRDTRLVLVATIMLFTVWMVGTLLVA